MRVAVVGGGAAGSLAAIFLARGGADVVLLEKNEKLMKKLFITGKGRCNLANACDEQTLFQNVVRGEKFLRSAFYDFLPASVMEFFESLGVPLTVERGNRVFPTSGKSSDVIRAIERELYRQNVDVRLRTEVQSVKFDDKFRVSFKGEDGKVQSVEADRVIIATGGASYPLTGSTGDGYKFAKSFGHSVVEPRQSLVALITDENVKELQGLSLKNVELSAYSCGKRFAREQGEMLFTDKGVSGPIVLTVSSYGARLEKIKLSLDLKPALDEKTLDARLQRELAERANQELKNIMRSVLPERLNMYVLKRAQIDGTIKGNSLTKEQRSRIVKTMKGLEFSVKSPAPFSEAVITAGGVELSGLTPKCESKNMGGLYFVGEVIDADALTGGFNLQIAWSTAKIAALDILKQ